MTRSSPPNAPFGRRGFLFAALAALSGCGARGLTAASTEDLPADLATRLRAGGYVIYFRHGATDRKGTDGPDMPREEQRLLSDEGIAQSRRIGRRFRALDIPVAEVRTSQMYRCREMGEIAFGTITIDPMLLNASNDLFGSGERIDYLRGLLATPVPEGGNLVLISHRPNILRAAGLGLAEGEAAVFRPGADGTFALVARVLPEQW